MKKLYLSFILLIIFQSLFAIPAPVAQQDVSSLLEEYKVKQSAIFFTDDEGISHEFGNLDDIYEGCELGELVTAYVTMKLVEEKKILLSDPINKYVENVLKNADRRFKDITVKNLLTHTAGFSNHYEFGADRNIYANPGTQVVYSSIGYSYLQEIIEKVTEKPFEQVCREYVFEPFNMNHSTFEEAKTIRTYISLISACTYCFAFFIIMFTLCFLFFLFRRIHKKQRKTTKWLFVKSFILATILNTVFLLFIMSKLLLAFIIFVIAEIILLIVFRKGKGFYISFFALLFTLIVICVSTSYSMPVPQNLVHQPVNCSSSLKTSARDMVSFLSGLLEESKEPNTIFQMMMSENIKIDSNYAWGLGFCIKRTQEGNICFHTGDNLSFQNLVLINPEKNSLAVVLTNSNTGLAFAKDFLQRELNLPIKYYR